MAEIRNTYNALRMFIESVSRVISQIGKVVQLVEKIASIGDHINRITSQIAAFFAVFTSAFLQLHKLWTHLCLLITSLTLLCSPIFKTTQWIVQKSSAVLDNITHGCIKTRLSFQKILMTLGVYLTPLFNSGHYLTDMFDSIRGNVAQLFYYTWVVLYDILANTCRILLLPMVYIFSLFINNKRTLTIAKED